MDGLFYLTISLGLIYLVYLWYKTSEANDLKERELKRDLHSNSSDNYNIQKQTSKKALDKAKIEHALIMLVAQSAQDGKSTEDEAIAAGEAAKRLSEKYKVNFSGSDIENLLMNFNNQRLIDAQEAIKNWSEAEKISMIDDMIFISISDGEFHMVEFFSILAWAEYWDIDKEMILDSIFSNNYLMNQFPNLKSEYEGFKELINEVGMADAIKSLKTK